MSNGRLVHRRSHLDPAVSFTSKLTSIVQVSLTVVRALLCPLAIVISTSTRSVVLGGGSAHFTCYWQMRSTLLVLVSATQQEETSANDSDGYDGTNHNTGNCATGNA